MDSYYIYVKVLLKQQPQNVWPKHAYSIRTSLASCGYMLDASAYIEQMMLVS